MKRGYYIITNDGRTCEIWQYTNSLVGKPHWYSMGIRHPQQAPYKILAGPLDLSEVVRWWKEKAKDVRV